MVKPIQVARSSMPGFDEYVEEIRDLWESRWLTNMGAKHTKLESELKQYLSVPDIALFANGHLALESAIAAFQLKGEVITTPFTFVSTTHAIVRNGLEPVFSDVSQEDYTIDVNQIESLITEKTSAILPVHVYGNICDLTALEQICTKYKLRLIYDAAHAFGVTVNGIGIGAFGDASMFSFHATKVYHTIEGGAVTFCDGSLKSTLDSLKNFGMNGKESVDYIGSNGKMNEFQAAMGLCNLRHVDNEIAKRKLVAQRYQENLQGTKGIKLPEDKPGVKGNYAYFPVVFDGYKKTREQVFTELENQNVIARKYFYPLTNCFNCYKGRFNAEAVPVAKYMSDRVLTLPLYSDLMIEEVDRICKIIKS